MSSLLLLSICSVFFISIIYKEDTMLLLCKYANTKIHLLHVCHSCVADIIYNTMRFSCPFISTALKLNQHDPSEEA